MVVANADLKGFPCVEAYGGSVLILGSMPSQRSLQKAQYYGHPRNAFWPIMGELFDAGPDKPYEERLAILTGHQIVLWDVLKACRRPGSLDASIDEASVVINDFAGLLHRHSGIRQVFFNGRKAAELFRRRVSIRLPEAARLSCQVLPSTSPAYAGMQFGEKLERWRAVRAAVSLLPSSERPRR